jgi:hypothetical protein
MMESKSTNPKDALGIKKAPLHLVPTGPLYEVGLAMLEGGRKYGAHNFRAAGTRASVYYDAAMRHINQWWEGEDIDPESGVHHLMKAAACLFVQRDSQMMGNDVDDRPIKYPNGLPLKKFNEQTKGLIEKHRECAEPFTQAKFEANELGEIQTWESDEDEEYHEFTIRRPQVSGKGWYVALTRALGKNYSGKLFLHKDGKLFLHKDLELHRGTGYHNGRHGYGEAPGYFKSKAHAKNYITCRRLMGRIFGGNYVAG